MARKNYDIEVSGRPSPHVQKAIDMTTAVVGLQTADAAAAAMPAGLPRTIVRGGMLPIAATQTLELAGRDYSKKKRRY